MVLCVIAYKVAVFNGLLPQVFVGFKYLPTTKKVLFTSCFLTLRELFYGFSVAPVVKGKANPGFIIKRLNGINDL